MSVNLIVPKIARRHRLAAVDVGTNTLRLLIADVDQDHRIVPVAGEREMTRLGEGLIHSGRISDAAIERSVKALSRFAERIREYPPERTAVVATSAVREAENGADFVARVEAETGLDVSVIGGDEEARLTSLGAGSVLNGDRNDLLILDIGGGSTEFIHIKGGTRVGTCSVPLGVVTATERCISRAPAPMRERYELDEYIRGHMETVRRELGNIGQVRLVATAGTPTTLAAVDQEMVVYDPGRINNYRLALGRVEELHDWLADLSIRERAAVNGVEAGREELIVAGCAILLRVMHDYQFGVVVVSDWGLREGVLIDLFEQIGK